MKRNEGIVVAAVAVLVGGYFAAVVFASAWLNGQVWFGVSANLIQHVSGPATFAAVVTGFYAYWTRRCAVPWCVRHGEHPVDGTLKKVCAHHHTHHHHELVHDLHGLEHRLSGRLGFGESHGCGRTPPS